MAKQRLLPFNVISKYQEFPFDSITTVALTFRIIRCNKSMGKSFKTRVREFFCCFHDVIEDVISPLPRPNSCDEKIEYHNIEVKDKGEVRIKVAYNVLEKPKKLIEVFEANDEKANLLEIIKDGGNDRVIKVRCTAAGIGRQILQSYINKDTVYTSKDVEYQDDDNKIKKTKEIVNPRNLRLNEITTCKGRRQNWQAVNLWSRHLCESLSANDLTTPETLLYTNVNYSKIEIPMMKTVHPRNTNKDVAECKSYQRMLSTIDTRDRKVRPKAARGTRTAHWQPLDKKIIKP